MPKRDSTSAQKPRQQRSGGAVFRSRAAAAAAEEQVCSPMCISPLLLHLRSSAGAEHSVVQAADSINEDEEDDDEAEALEQLAHFSKVLCAPGYRPVH